MYPTRAFVDEIGVLLAQDTGIFAEANPFIQVALVKAPFSPSLARVLADLSLADFDGYAALHAPAVNGQLFHDPATGEQIVQVKEPVNGWHWVTTGVTNLPQTIHGYALINAAGTVLHAMQLLDAPVILSAVNQAIDIGYVRVRLNPLLVS